MKNTSPYSLAQSIQYQEGSVVSKEVSRRDSGTMTLFAFDAGQGLSEHKTPFEAFVYIIDGEAEITVAGFKHIVKQGEMLSLPAQNPHALKAEVRFKMLLIMMK